MERRPARKDGLNPAEELAELERKLAPFLVDDFIGSEAEFWRLMHRYLKLKKQIR